MGELPVYTCQAHVFSINPQTKKSWIPASLKAVDVNFFFDNTKQCYRIISVEDGPGGKKIIINSTLTEKMTFKKTSQKFGQWADSKTGVVHGLGFNSENELTEFVNHFKQYVDASKGSAVGPPTSSNGRTIDAPATIPGVNASITSNQANSLTASLGPPALVGVSSLNCTQPTLTSPPLAFLSSPPHTDSTSSASHSAAQLQQQLKQTQNQVRRLEEELNMARRQASIAGVPLSSNFMSFPSSEMTSSSGDGSASRSASHSNGNDASDLRDCISRLELNGTILNGAGEDCSTLVHSLTTKVPGIPLGRNAWTDRTNMETVRILHARLGHILQEALELHNRLGALLPQGIPGAPPE